MSEKPDWFDKRLESVLSVERLYPRADIVVTIHTDETKCPEKFGALLAEIIKDVGSKNSWDDEQTVECLTRFTVDMGN